MGIRGCISLSYHIFINYMWHPERDVTLGASLGVFCSSFEGFGCLVWRDLGVSLGQLWCLALRALDASLRGLVHRLEDFGWMFE